MTIPTATLLAARSGCAPSAGGSARIRVIHVIDGLGTGGSERSLAELLPHLVDLGFAPIVACLHSRDEGVQSDVESLGVPVCVLHGSTLVSRVRELRRLIRDTRPVLVHTSLFDSDIVGRLGAATLRVPVLTSLVSTPYSAARRADPNVRQRRLRTVQFIDAMTARYLTHWFHAVSYAVRAHAVSALGIQANRVTVVERGRDPARFRVPSSARRKLAREALALGMDDEVLLNVGRQEFAKDQQTLLLAFNVLARERPRARLLIAGRTGHATQSLLKIFQGLESRDRIRFLSHRDDVPELLAASDVFVFPSVYEGLPGAVIEAMAQGLPVVASRIPAIEEVVDEGKNALLVTPSQPEQLAAALNAVLENEDLSRAFGDYGRRIFLERFTIERSAKRMAELFRQLVGQHCAFPARLTQS